LPTADVAKPTFPQPGKGMLKTRVMRVPGVRLVTGVPEPVFSL
jgi:hypothetical protein